MSSGSNKYLSNIGSKDVVELVADVLGYTVVQSIRGDLSKAGKQILPFTGNVVVYNFLIRNLINTTKWNEWNEGRPSVGLNTLFELIILTAMMQIERSMGAFGLSQKRALVEDFVDTLGALGVSTVLLQLKEEIIPMNGRR